MKLDLCTIQIFDGLPDSTLREIYSLPIQKLVLNQGDAVVHAGDSIESLLAIHSGLLKQAKHLSSGDERVVAYYYEGEVYPIHLFFSGVKEWPYDIYADYETTVYLIPWNEFHSIVYQHQKLIENILVYTAQCTTHSKIVLNATRYKKIRERLAYWLVYSKYVTANKIPATQKILSDTLRVTRPSLNQELKKLEREGIISIRSNHIDVLDYDFLLEFLEDI